MLPPQPLYFILFPSSSSRDRSWGEDLAAGHGDDDDSESDGFVDEVAPLATTTTTTTTTTSI
jgi:hypothetical protein